VKELLESYPIPYYELSVKNGSIIDDVFLTAIENTCRNIDEKRWGDVKDLEKFGI
jgi:hypothetical protein